MDHQRSRNLVRKLARRLARSSAHVQPDTIHDFRTLARRIEAALRVGYASSGEDDRKLVRSLRRLRRNAAAVRDIDVQIAALRKLKIGREEKRRAALLEVLLDRRAKREREFLQWFSGRRRTRLRRRLERSAAAFDAAATAGAGASSASAVSLEPASEALRRFASSARRTSLNAENLHAFRTFCKKARYIAEMGADERSDQLVADLKRVQDAIGEWHDWDALRATAEETFGSSMDSALMMALRNVTRAKYEEARLIAVEVRRDLLAQYRSQTAAAKRSPESPVQAAAGVARRKSPRRASAAKSLTAANSAA